MAWISMISRDLGILLISVIGVNLPIQPITPPEQPSSGPGGATYKHQSVKQTRYTYSDLQFWIFEPEKPTPRTAPVIVFNHGWSVTNPKVYGAWIKHLVRRGNIVIYPRYQKLAISRPWMYTDNAILETRNALNQLQSGNHVKPDLDKFAVVGHSMGATIAINMAAKAKSVGLPIPKAVMCIEPTGELGIRKEVIPFEDLSKISPQTLLLVVTAEEDLLVGDLGAKQIFRQTTSIPLKNKNLIAFGSDFHGFPPLLADHLAPIAIDNELDSGDFWEPSTLTRGLMIGQNTNALDYYGFWKLFNALTDAAFYRINRDYALGNTAKQRYMGEWSDGSAVREPTIVERP